MTCTAPISKNILLCFSVSWKKHMFQNVKHYYSIIIPKLCSLTNICCVTGHSTFIYLAYFYMNMVKIWHFCFCHLFLLYHRRHFLFSYPLFSTILDSMIFLMLPDISCCPSVQWLFDPSKQFLQLYTEVSHS